MKGMIVTLPIGEGQFTVWGIQIAQRDNNQGLSSNQQAVSNEVEIYRTNDEAEARKLVLESGFESDGVFFATTRYANTAALAHKQVVQEASGVLKRDDPRFDH